MAKTKNEAGAFLQALKSELDGIRADLRKDLARQVYGDGTAKIATTTAASGTGGVTLTVGQEPIRKGQFYPNQLVYIYNAAGTLFHRATALTAGPAWNFSSDANAFLISSVDLTNGTITIDSRPDTPATTFTVAGGDYLTRAGVASYSGTSETPIGQSGGTYSRSDEVDGIQRIVSDSATAFGGIDPSVGSAYWWDNQRIAAGSTDLRQNSQDPQGVSGSTLVQNLTFGTVQQGLNKARIAGGMPSSIVTSFGVQREFYTLFTTQVQYIDPKTLDYQQGFKTLSYNGMPVIADIEAPYGKMYILDESTLKVYSDQDWHFLDADGLTLRQVTGYDKFEAIMARYMNLGATRRNNQVVITGIKVDGSTDAGY
jgi:hypothetical protein